jgi:integrase
MRKDWDPDWNPTHGWQVDFTVGGQRVRRRLGIRDKGSRDIARAAAKALWDDAWKRHLDPAPARPLGTPLHVAARRYVEAGGEARYLPRILRHAGPDMMVEDVDEAWILDAAAAIYPDCKPDTVRRHLRVPLDAILNHHAGRRRRQGTDTRRTRWLTPEEAERLLAAAARLTLPRHPAPERQTLRKIAFLLGTGCRPGECFTAEVQHWNPATRQWWIPAEERGAGKTPGAARWVRLPPRAAELVQNGMPEVGRAFLTPYGRPIVVGTGHGGQMQTAFNAARDAAGLGEDVTPYTLRHTWATWFYAQTRDFGALMDLGGWDKADTANRYRKLAPDDLADRLFAHGWDFRIGQNLAIWPAHGKGTEISFAKRTI